jgi:hypothetical protein
MKMKKIWFAVCLLLTSHSTLADTLYQANVGDYTVGTGIGVGIGYGDQYTDLYNVTPGGYTYYAGVNGIPYEGPNFPYSSQCCRGCNNCNNDNCR